MDCSGHVARHGSTACMQIFADLIAGDDTKLSNCLLQHFVSLEFLVGTQLALDSDLVGGVMWLQLDGRYRN